MENPEELLHSLEEFSKMKPKDIPRELEEYLCFVAKTGNPVYQWPIIKSLFREKLLNVITEFYESYPSVEIPPCPNVEMFNYDLMKNFILEKLDTFASAPFTVQRICELLTTPRKEYNRIDKYMRALEKNILVVSTTEPCRRSTENGESVVNGIEPEHLPESSNSSHDINVEEMDESPSWPRTTQIDPILFETSNNSENPSTELPQNPERHTFESTTDVKLDGIPSSISVSATTPDENLSQETMIPCPTIEPEQPYVSIEPVVLNSCVTSQETVNDESQSDTSLSITALPAGVQQRRNSLEKGDLSEEGSVEIQKIKETPFLESNKQKFSEDEEQLQSSTETTCTTICTDHIKDTEEGKCEKIPLDKEECATDILLEKSLQVEETSQSDIDQENNKSGLENIEKLDDKSDQVPLQTEVNEVHLDEDTNSEDTKEPEEIISMLKSTSSLEENESKDSILEVSNDTEYISEICSSSSQEISESIKHDEVCKPDDIPEYDEFKVQEPDMSEAKQINSNVQIPMDVDILSEIKVDEKEEHLCETPTSTSNTI